MSLLLSDFTPYVGTGFTIPLSDGGVYRVTLFEATALRTGLSFRPAGEPFQLMFRGPGPAWLPQQIHLLRHPEIGDHPIGLVPIGRDEEGFIYQAVFN